MISNDNLIFIENRFFVHHEQREDIKCGFFSNKKPTLEKKELCVGLLKDANNFWQIMCEIRQNWKNSFKVNLSNKTINRRAWLGQASCCYAFGCSCFEVMKYWNYLNEDEQFLANKTANKMIKLFEMEDLNAKNTFGNRRFNRCTRTIEMDF